MTSLPFRIPHRVEGGHHLVGRIERQRCDPRVPLAGEGRIHAALGGKDDQRTLGRIADEGAIADLGVRAQGHRQEVLLEGTSGWPPVWVICPVVW